MAGNGVTYAVVKAFGDELRARMPELQDVIGHFPEPNEELTYPCASISLGEPDFEAHGPYVIRKEDIATDDEDYVEPGVGEIAKKRVIRAVGKYVIPMQLDFWVATKFERNKIYESFFAAFNRDSVAPGVRLELADYYDEWCDYIMTGFSIADSEDQSQRSEWRVKVAITVDVRGVTQTPEFTIEEIETTLEAQNVGEGADLVDPEEDDSEETTII